MSGTELEVEHRRVGRLRVCAAEVIHFDGIPGFPEARRFALVGDDRSPRFAWLACIDDATLALPVAGLRDVAPEHHARLGPEQLSAVGAKDVAEVEAFAVVNLRRQPPTAQVDAPLLVNAVTRRGAQVLLPSPESAVDAPGLAEPAPPLAEPRIESKARIGPEPQIESKPQT